MTNEIKNLLEKIKNDSIFEDDIFFFVGGTALSVYLNHRVSYDIDIACTTKLPISKINTFAFNIGARAIADKNTTQFKINSGEDIKNYHMKFMVDGVKLEFSYFREPMQKSIISNAQSKPYKGISKLKILELDDIIKLKIFALFNRHKTRDLFDAAVILENDLLKYEELERIYSFIQDNNSSIREYIDKFKPYDDDGDNSLDFLPQHKYYKLFAKKKQEERFELSKDMLLEQYDKKQKENLSSIQRTVKQLRRK